MNDTYVTVVGNVVDDPRHVVTAGGIHVANVRMASTSRRFDRGAGEWRDAGTLYVGISCWRSLADNVAASVRKGDPLVVTGRLRMRSYTTNAGQRRTSVEIDASAVGHDLSRGVTHFQKSTRYGVERQPGTAGEEANTAGKEESQSLTEGLSSSSVPDNEHSPGGSAASHQSLDAERCAGAFADDHMAA